MKTFTQIFRLLLASCACLTVTLGWSKTEVNVQTAGTLSSLISTSEKELKVTGFINGSDIKFIRQLINSGKVTTLDWSEVSIVAGGDFAYASNSKNFSIPSSYLSPLTSHHYQVMPSRLPPPKRQRLFVRQSLTILHYAAITLNTKEI